MKKKFNKYSLKRKYRQNKKYRNKKKKIKIKKYILKLFSILFLIILYILLYFKNKNNFSILEEIISFENNLNLTKEKFNSFRQINSENKLIEENPNFKKSENPDITVIMLIYNQAYYLHKGLRSIQNQSIKNIEIILIDDCSQDNSVDIIKNFQRDDERIILISHDTNEGKLKSRCDGIKIAKGKYITIIDGDDALIHKDILKNSLFIAQKANLDALQFLIFYVIRGRYQFIINEFNFTNNSYIITQPELKNKYFGNIHGKKYLLGNRNICGKVIKNELFQKMLEFIGKEYTEDYMNWAEDTIMAVSLFHLAKSFYIMREPGYYYSSYEPNRVNKIKNKKCKANDKLKNFFEFKYIKFLVDKSSSNDLEKNNIYDELNFFNNKYFLRNTTKLEKRHYQILFYIFDKMLQWNALSKEKLDYIEFLRNKTVEKKMKDNID